MSKTPGAGRTHWILKNHEDAGAIDDGRATPSLGYYMKQIQWYGRKILAFSATTIIFFLTRSRATWKTIRYIFDIKQYQYADGKFPSRRHWYARRRLFWM